jgi:chromosomal replication initiation ATPase DnaA
MKAQIPLSFPVVESMGNHDFMPSECNQEALDWIDRFPDWPYPCLIIIGEHGSGKTHLLSIWKDIARDGDTAIDDLDLIIGDNEKEIEVFHLFNQAKENNNFLLITLSDPQSLDLIALPDLKSRLKASPIVHITAPDDEALQAVLVKSFHDRQLKIEPDVVAYILPRIERSFLAVHQLVSELDRQALSMKRPVTIPLVREILSDPKLFD